MESGLYSGDVINIVTQFLQTCTHCADGCAHYNHGVTDKYEAMGIMSAVTSSTLVFRTKK